MSEQIFRGSPGIPHVSEEFFGCMAAGAMIATALVNWPGKAFMPETKPRAGIAMNRDNIVQATEQFSQVRREISSSSSSGSLLSPKEHNMSR